MNKSLTDRAGLFALWQHMKAGHEYGKMPYFYHCSCVLDIAEQYMPADWSKSLYNGDPWTRSEIIGAACLCHDILEDTGLSYNDIKDVIGRPAADIVFLLTDEPGKTRAERHLRTYPKIASCRLATFVKLCDRLANRQEGGKADMYDREYQAFRDVFYIPEEYSSLWDALDLAHNFDKNGPLVKTTA